MHQIGQKIRDAREDRGISLEELSARTMITKKQLIALENGDFAVFAGEVYLKGAIRSVAAEIGLDHRQLLDLYCGKDQRADTEADREKPTSRITKRKRRAKSAAEAKRRHKPDYLLLLLISVLVLAGLYWAYTTYWPREEPEFLTPADVEQPHTELPDEKADEPEETPYPEPVRVERDALSSGVVFNVYNAETLEADLIFTGRCWIEVHADGQIALSREFTADQREKITAGRELRLRIGAPRNFELLINGADVELPDTSFAFSMTVRLID